MSMRAILLAVRDHLRTPTPQGTAPTAVANTGIGHLMPDPARWIDVTIDGKPWATAHNVFVGIWPGSFQATSTSTECLDEHYEVNITVTVSSLGQPEDRHAQMLVCPDTVDGRVARTQYTGLLTMCEAIRASLHLNYHVTTLANAYITRATTAAGVNATNGFEEPLFFAGISRPERKGGSWWSANRKEQIAGFAATVSMSPCRRTQRADLQT